MLLIAVIGALCATVSEEGCKGYKRELLSLPFSKRVEEDMSDVLNPVNSLRQYFCKRNVIYIHGHISRQNLCC